jgi:hypothetical protein
MRRALFAIAIAALALPSQALARGDFDPTTEFEQHEWVPIHLGPLDLSITKAVVYLMLGSVLTIVFGTLLMRWRLAVEPTIGRRSARRSTTSPDADRRAGPPVEGDQPLVPVRRDALPVHPRGQPDRVHPTAAHGRDVHRLPGLRHLRGDRRPRP